MVEQAKVAVFLTDSDENVRRLAREYLGGFWPEARTVELTDEPDRRLMLSEPGRWKDVPTVELIDVFAREVKAAEKSNLAMSEQKTLAAVCGALSRGGEEVDRWLEARLLGEDEVGGWESPWLLEVAAFRRNGKVLHEEVATIRDFTFEEDESLLLSVFDLIRRATREEHLPEITRVARLLVEESLSDQAMELASALGAVRLAGVTPILLELGRGFNDDRIVPVQVSAALAEGLVESDEAWAFAVATALREDVDTTMLDLPTELLAWSTITGRTMTVELLGELEAAMTRGQQQRAARGAEFRRLYELLEKKREQDEARAERRTDQLAAREKVGRNDPCPCGSGKKYKKCCEHGKPAAPPAKLDAAPASTFFSLNKPT